MKFTRRFEEDLQDVGWESYYLQYKKLKQAILFISLIYTSDDIRNKPSVLKKIKSAITYSSFSVEKQLEVKQPTSLQSSSNIKNDIDKNSYLQKAVKIVNSFLTSDAELDIDISIDNGKSVFLEQLEKALVVEIKKIETFSTNVLNDVNTLKLETLTDLGKLLNTSNLAEHVHMEYIFRLTDEEKNILSNFAFLVIQVESICKFLFVNSAAIKRLVDKVSSLVDLNGEEAFLSRVMKHNERIENKLAEVTLLKVELEQVSGSLMCSSSCYYEYLQDHIKSLETYRFRTKLTRYETELQSTQTYQKMRRFARLLDLEANLRPHQFLATCVHLVFGTLFATYAITYVDKQNTVFDERGYFISASIDQQPAANIGSLGLNISLCLIGMIIFVKHRITNKQLRQRVWMSTHRVSYIVGISSVLAGMGVAAFQCRSFPKTHNIFAAFFFILGTIFVILETIIERKNKLATYRETLVRTCLALLVFVSVLTFLFCEIYLRLSTGVSIEQKHRIRVVGAVFELLGFSSLVLWFGTFYSTFTNYNFQLHVHRKSQQSHKLYL